ncbi:dihydroorotate oxidase [Enterococcus faecalis]|uniref:dihydroorotate oxidase n=1 Tax=Enterococcus TaxID=1350 RepID=UPI00046C7151|nr:dihydroorotate oxidase [Enterococcus faecalis]EGO2676720.1 dihydroorotate oxidase [Enterococcus faecalis]EGO2720876.1 dihydroorotate oxidase [Enterococcus faecalis]EGO2846704.1 dihydroorotate oxidase [Enterococcus faecalis]EGO5117220.1 dihydroorotate oxidase [Enterococcus faecalis]EGO5240631.1 dihydroorotate oxidase [Enterococcus faecalis]
MSKTIYRRVFLLDISVEFSGHKLANVLMNASGIHCMTIKEMDELAASQAGSFVAKTATPNPRQGNEEPRYFDTPLGSINSMGLPNLGIDYYLDYQIARQKEFPEELRFLSVSGMNYEENIAILKKVQESEYTGVTEFNLSCPNLPGKPQIAYDFELTEKLLTEVFQFFTKPLGVKLPPFFDIAHFDAMAEILNKFPLVYVNSINSIGNGLYIDSDKEEVVIKPKGGFGGLGGEYVKPTALANVRAFAQRLKPEIKIIGTGGITCGKDVFEHLLCGATLVQVGTQLHQEGPQVFARLAKELQEIMAAKGYESIEEFRGKLKEM